MSMKTKVCAICGSTFETNSPIQCLCSDTCRKVAKMIYNEKYAASNPEKIREANKKWASNNPDKVRELSRKNYLKDPQKYHKKAVKYHAKRRAEDEGFRILCNHRASVRKLLNSSMKSTRVLEWLGCSPADFKAYLESLFQEGMTWENRGQGKGLWTIDHIQHLASFDLTNEEDRKVAFNYRNLQPLYWEQNKKKALLEMGCR